METYKALFYDKRTGKLITIQFSAMSSIAATLEIKNIERNSGHTIEFYDWHKDCYGF